MARYEKDISEDYESAVLEAPDGVKGVGSTLKHFWIQCPKCYSESLSLPWFEKVLQANRHLYPKLFEYYAIRNNEYLPNPLDNYVSRERSICIWFELRKIDYSHILFHCPFCNYERKYPFVRYELDREFIMIYYGNRTVDN